jgi:hypothetical protein
MGRRRASGAFSLVLITRVPTAERKAILQLLFRPLRICSASGGAHGKARSGATMVRSPPEVRYAVLASLCAQHHHRRSLKTPRAPRVRVFTGHRGVGSRRSGPPALRRSGYVYPQTLAPRASGRPHPGPYLLYAQTHPLFQRDEYNVPVAQLARKRQPTSSRTNIYTLDSNPRTGITICSQAGH